MYRFTSLAAVIAASLVAVSSASANPANAIQPAHVYFGDVVSGQHPNRLVKLTNKSGKLERIRAISIAGSFGGKFTLVGKSKLIDDSLLPRCQVGMRIGLGSSCVFDVRVKTLTVGWWRSVLGVRMDYEVGGNTFPGNFASAELRAHVVP